MSVDLGIPNEIEFELVELKKGNEFPIIGNKIVTVINGNISDREKGELHTFESSTYHVGNIKAEVDSLLTVFDIKNFNVIIDEINVNNNFGNYCRKNWSQLRQLWDVDGFEKVDLYRGKQITKEFNGEQYKFNLWFCGPRVDCLFHNQHDFIEIHTNIAGKGFMQKALTGKNDGTDSLIETVGLMPGNSHRTFNIKGESEENGNPQYPFHRWLGGSTGNIWLAVEKY